MGAIFKPAASSLSRLRRDFHPGRLIVVLCCAAAVSEARAAEPAIDWEAPAGCSDVQRVMAVAAEVTGQDPVVVPPDRRIRGVVAANGPDWQLTLTLLDGARERTRVIAAPSCSQLVRAAGVALALALEPEGVLAAPEGAEAEGASGALDARDAEVDAGEPALDPKPLARGADAVPATRSPEVAVAEASNGTPVELDWRAEADALLDAASLGGAAPGLGVSFGVRHHALMGFFYGVWLPARRQAVDGGGAVEFSLGAGGLRGCYELARGVLAVDARASIELGQLMASGEQLDNAASFADWWLAPSLGIALRSELPGPIYFRAGADAVLPVLREAYRVNDGALVHRAPSVGFRGAVALGVVIGDGG